MLLILIILNEVDYVEDDRRNGDREWEEASKAADKSNEEVKIGSEGRDGYFVVCDDDDSGNNFIEDSNEGDDIIDVNNDNANNNISNNHNDNSNNNNGNIDNGSHSIDSSISGRHNHIRNLNYLSDIDYVGYHMNEIIKNGCSNIVCEFDIEDDDEFLKEAGILLLLILLFIPLCIY
ncbi:hypothetical protein EWB00_011376 [Schistosoma japonicum]|uniref:Uncharacterized protein n=1 Tax=Schistosoma japonicum TaxID=6182 RepID=A0A4Z2CKF5_SCHJA|nr:hypothetical protein EWB00_011376 [Schistosoma japonicum]